MITRVKVKFDKLYGQTERAYLLLINNTEMWFPRRFCWYFVLNKKLGGHMVIPTWLYKEKFGCDPEIEDAATIVEHHVPERIEPIEIEPDKNLVK